jgi:hypothetical protein
MRDNEALSMSPMVRVEGALDLIDGLLWKAAYDETLVTALKRKHEPQRFVSDLLRAEILEK